MTFASRNEPGAVIASLLAAGLDHGLKSEQLVSNVSLGIELGHPLVRHADHGADIAIGHSLSAQCRYCILDRGVTFCRRRLLQPSGFAKPIKDRGGSVITDRDDQVQVVPLIQVL